MYFIIGFLEISKYSQENISVGVFFNKVAGLRSVGWFLLKRVGLVIVCVIYTLLVETIPTSFYCLTGRNQKLVQNKPLQQRLFVLILEF